MPSVSIEHGRIEVGGITVDVVRKQIKNLHLGVYPPDGRVRVAVPWRLKEDEVRLAVISRLGWIRRRRAEFEEQARQSKRDFLTGESHYFQGRRYLLDVVTEDRPPKVKVVSSTRIRLQVRPEFDRDRREEILSTWYRSTVKAAVPQLLRKWEPKLEVTVEDCRVRRMRTRWGSCNAEARRVWLNSELAKKPPRCLEYILVHEMVHLLERNHTDRFKELMDRFMPNWRTHRSELNRAPLAHEDWAY